RHDLQPLPVLRAAEQTEKGPAMISVAIPSSSVGQIIERILKQRAWGDTALDLSTIDNLHLAPQDDPWRKDHIALHREPRAVQQRGRFLRETLLEVCDQAVVARVKIKNDRA